MPGSLESKPLPEPAVHELQAVAEWLQSEEVEFRFVDGINICNNKDGLTKVTSNLINQLATKAEMIVRPNYI